VGGEDLAAAIGGAVVDHDDLEVCPGLAPERVEGAVERGLSIADGKKHRRHDSRL
jgi:hypothetical protein